MTRRPIRSGLLTLACVAIVLAGITAAVLWGVQK